MPAVIDTGMDKADLKKLLIKSKQEPVNFAAGIGPLPKVALLMLAKNKGGAAIAKQLKDRGSKQECFGYADVDMEEDPKLVKFHVNKALPGIGKRLVKTLKGTSFTKVQIILPGGIIAEDVSEEEDADEDDLDSGVETSETENTEELLDAAALTTAFRALAAKISQIDQAHRTPLLTLAAPIPESLKATDLHPAARLIEALRDAVEKAVAEPGTGTNGTQSGVDYTKSKQIWIATRVKVQLEIERLRTSIMQTYAGQKVAGEIESSFRTTVDPVLQKLDTEFADKLDAIAKPVDAAERTKLVGEARGVLQRYAQYVSGDKLIGELDNNPFTPLAIRQTVTGSLAALAQTVK